MLVEELKNEKEWETFLEESLDGTFYHSLEWKRVIQMSFGHHDLYLTMKDENGKIIGICPGFITGSMRLKMYDSMPYSDYGGPVIARQHIKEASFSLQSFLQNFCSDNGITNARFCFTDVALSRFFRSPLGWNEVDQGIMEVDLKATPAEFLWNRILSYNLRRNIRCVEQRGFEAKEARTKSDLRDFYDLYYRSMRYIGANPYPFKFLENMWSVLYPSNLHIWLLERNSIAGGMLLFKDKRKSYCVYSGFDRKQRIEIVNYLIWKEIKQAEKEGRRYVSLGSTPSDPRHPYYIQKKRFGSSFYQKETVWCPIGSMGSLLLQTKIRSMRLWGTIRNFLPIGFKRILESRVLKS